MLKASLAVSPRKTTVSLLSLFLFLIGISLSQAGVIHNAANDFSISSNPNGVWQYGSTSTLYSSFNLSNTSGTAAGVDYWINNWTQAHPFIIYNPTNSDVNYGPATLKPGQLAVHPGPNNEYPVLRFVASTSGIYDLSAEFEGIDRDGVTTDVHVLHNGNSIFSGSVNGFGSASRQSFSSAFTLNAGDSVDFKVGYGANGNYFSDSTAVSVIFTTSTVPEPSSAIIVGLPALFLFVRRNVRRLIFVKN